MQTHRIHPELLERQVRVLVVGCGGTGSAFVAGLPYLHQSLIARGHPEGMHVTVLDGDTISPTNCIRLPFSRSEIGLNKGIVLVNRLNLFWGLKWDAIPAHLLTREAFQLCQDRLDEDGLLVLHISNSHINLEPIVAELAWDQKLVALIQEDMEVSPREFECGKFASTWVLMARRREHLGRLADSKRWRSLERPPSPTLWRDDYTNLLPILRWN